MAIVKFNISQEGKDKVQERPPGKGEALPSEKPSAVLPGKAPAAATIDYTTAIVQLPLEQLMPYQQTNYGVDDAELSLLVDDIRGHGVLVPLQVRPSPDGRYMILSGHRRAMACARLGYEKVPAIVKDVDDATAEIIFHATNIHNRMELSALDRARGYKALMEHLLKNGNASMREKFKDADISYRMVKRYISLLDLLDPLQVMVDDGSIGVAAGSEIARLSIEKQDILLQYIQGKRQKFKINEKQAAALVASTEADFRVAIKNVLEPERKSKDDLGKKLNQWMKQQKLNIPANELLEIIKTAVLAYKEQGAKQ